MAKRITYKVLFAEVNNGTNEEPNIEQIFIDRVAICPTETSFNEMMPIIKKEAAPGTIAIRGEFDRVIVVAPRNIVAGEYVTIDNTLYLATENIPNGAPVIVGRNALETTVEQQLYQLTKGE